MDTAKIDEVVELLAQIFLTIQNCEPDFNEVTLEDVLDFLGVKKRYRTYMYRLCLSDAALRLISEAEHGSE